MTGRELLRWQGEGYPRYHRSRGNLLIHVAAVPVFLLGSVGLLSSAVLLSWKLGVASLVGMVASMAAQGRGHRLEAVPPEPFTGPANALARVVLEQWVTFPRFVLSGGWARALRSRRDSRSGNRPSFSR
jgi:hypothetical protein